MMQMIAPMLRDKIQSVIKVRGPELKAVLYTHGIAKLFVLELAPLLTVSGRPLCKTTHATVSISTHAVVSI